MSHTERFSSVLIIAVIITFQINSVGGCKQRASLRLCVYVDVCRWGRLINNFNILPTKGGGGKPLETTAICKRYFTCVFSLLLLLTNPFLASWGMWLIVVDSWPLLSVECSSASVP